MSPVVQMRHLQQPLVVELHKEVWPVPFKMPLRRESRKLVAAVCNHPDSFVATKDVRWLLIFFIDDEKDDDDDW